jgi:cytidine deaminase
MSTDRIDDDADIAALHEAAIRVRANAHAPYSGYRVGVALIDDQGRTWLGCNVENASYPEGCCAETAAIAAMVAGGGQRIRELSVVGGHDEPGPCTPCGGCRQRISEFADAATRVWVRDAGGTMTAHGIDALLPAGFRLDTP